MGIVQQALVWILSWEVVGVIGVIFGPFGAIAFLVIALFGIHKVNSDRFMFQRWKGKFRNWRR